MGEHREPSFWSVIPDTVLSSTELKANAKLLYAKVTSLQTAKGFCYASNKYLANGLGLASDTVTRLLRELADAGYLRLEIVRDEKNAITERRIYPTIILPAIMPPSRTNARDPIGQTSDTPIGQTSDQSIKGLESKAENPPKAPQGAGNPKRAEKSIPKHKPERFEKFWSYYPRGESRKAAVRAWDKLAPDDAMIDKMAAALKRQMKSEDWQRGIGIPYASTWINGQRWEDEVKVVAPPPDVGVAYDPRGGLPGC